jgi:hypothetical protein
MNTNKVVVVVVVVVKVGSSRAPSAGTWRRSFDFQPKTANPKNWHRPVTTVALSAALIRRPRLPSAPRSLFFFSALAINSTSSSSFRLEDTRARFEPELLGNGAFNGDPSFKLLLRRLCKFSLLVLDAAAVAVAVNSGTVFMPPVAAPPREAASRCKSN